MSWKVSEFVRLHLTLFSFPYIGESEYICLWGKSFVDYYDQKEYLYETFYDKIFLLHPCVCVFLLPFLFLSLT